MILAAAGALILAAAAVAIDRLNFPQRPFQPERLPEGKVVHRDRTGAHIIEEDFDE